MSLTAAQLRPHLFRPGTHPAGLTLLALHGTGGDERDLLPLAREIAPEASVLSPRGTVTENGMLRFFERHPDGSFDRDDLLHQTAELADFVRAAAKLYPFDPSRLYALGFSNGANIAASLLLSRPAALAGAALLRAVLPYPIEQRPDLRGKRVLVASGDSDPYAPAGTVDALVDVLAQSGATVQRYRADAGHGLTPSDVRAARIWFEELGEAAA